MEAKEIFDETAKDVMIQWSVDDFKKTHPHMFRVIIQSMQEYADQQTAHLTEENDGLIKLIGDIHCNHEQYGYLTDDVVDRIEQALNEATN